MIKATDPFNPESPLPAHVQRMAKETQDTVERLVKLSDFINGNTFCELPMLEKNLMFEQRDQMTAYAKTLSLRYCIALLAHG